MEKTSNYYGCANELPSGDERLELYEKQREERGFDDTETWSLDNSLFQYLHPRLKRLVEIRKKTFAANERTDALERLCVILDEWSLKGTDSLLPEEAYKILSDNLHNMWW